MQPAIGKSRANPRCRTAENAHQCQQRFEPAGGDLDPFAKDVQETSARQACSHVKRSHLPQLHLIAMDSQSADARKPIQSGCCIVDDDDLERDARAVRVDGHEAAGHGRTVAGHDQDADVGRLAIGEHLVGKIDHCFRRHDSRRISVRRQVWLAGLAPAREAAL